MSYYVLQCNTTAIGEIVKPSVLSADFNYIQCYHFLSEAVDWFMNNSVLMDYLEFGHGDKNLVIIPGLSVQSVMDSAEAVKEAFKGFGQDFTIRLFDRRKNLPPVYSIADMAQDTVSVIRKLGLKDLYLFGASQGGMICMEIASSYPSLVHSMVLGSTSCRITKDRYRVIDHWVSLAKKGDPEALYLSFGEKLYPQAVFNQNRNLLVSMAKTVTQDELSRFIVLAETIRGFDIADRLERVACPVLVVGDTDDRVLGSSASAEVFECFKGRPDCALYMYEGYGHAVYDLAPDFRERMAAWFLK